MPRSLVPPLGCSMPSSTNRECEVLLTTGQAALLRRGMLVALARGEFKTATEREEAQALADMAGELDPDCVNGWCL